MKGKAEAKKEITHQDYHAHLQVLQKEARVHQGTPNQ